MSLLIRNGEIVTADSRYVADLFCEGETIDRIGKNLDVPANCQVIDATGKFVFPGFVDPHTHIYLPFMGTYSKDTYETASRAALLGGTTTFIDFCIPGKEENPADALATWDRQSEGKSYCDYTYHMAVTRFDAEVEAALRKMVAERGIKSFKVFLSYKGALDLSDSELYHLLGLARELGVIVAAHCENAVAVAERQQRLLAEGKTGPEWHHESRPPSVEADGTHHFLRFAELQGVEAYIVHLSCDEALRVAERAKASGQKVWVESLIQHLLLDKTYAERPDFEGAKYVMSPPLRAKGNQEALWAGVASGLVNVVATDHAPFDFATQKTMGRSDFTRIPNGIPSLEERVSLLYSEGVAAGRIDLHRFVDAASTSPARAYGLFPRKGAIQIGADADLVVFDPGAKWTMSKSTAHSAVDYSAFEGWKVTGRVTDVTVRGEQVVKTGEFRAREPRGRFLRR